MEKSMSKTLKRKETLQPKISASKTKSPTIKPDAKNWVSKFVECEVEHGTPKEKAELWAKQICVALHVAK
jgi:hypothetical protein